MANVDPKYDKVVRLYEDVTNLLVINVKEEVNPETDLPETIFRCLWTHSSAKCEHYFGDGSVPY